MDHFPKIRGETFQKNMLKPPPSCFSCFYLLFVEFFDSDRLPFLFVQALKPQEVAKVKIGENPQVEILSMRPVGQAILTKHVAGWKNEGLDATVDG